MISTPGLEKLSIFLKCREKFNCASSQPWRFQIPQLEKPFAEAALEWDMPRWSWFHKSLTYSFWKWSSRRNQRAIKTNCVLCDSNPLDYKLSSEDNLKVINWTIKTFFFFFFWLMTFLNSETPQHLQLCFCRPGCAPLPAVFTKTSHIPSFLSSPICQLDVETQVTLESLRWGWQRLGLPESLNDWWSQMLSLHFCQQPGASTSNFLRTRNKYLLWEITEIWWCL